MGRYLTPKPPKLSEEKKYDYQIRLLLAGDAATGKTTLVDQYVKDEKTVRRLDNNSIKNQTKRKVLEKNQKKISLQIVDTAGQERYRSLTPSYYCQAHGCLIVFDLTKKNTFHNVYRWSQDIHEYAPSGIRIILVGTNCLSKKREVTRERAEKFATSIGLEYVEVSTEDKLNITEPFDKLIDMIIKDLEIKSALYRLQDKEDTNKDACVIS